MNKATKLIAIGAALILMLTSLAACTKDKPGAAPDGSRDSAADGSQSAQETQDAGTAANNAADALLGTWMREDGDSVLEYTFLEGGKMKWRTYIVSVYVMNGDVLIVGRTGNEYRFVGAELVDNFGMTYVRDGDGEGFVGHWVSKDDALGVELTFRGDGNALLPGMFWQYDYAADGKTLIFAGARTFSTPYTLDGDSLTVNAMDIATGETGESITLTRVG